MVTQVNEYYYYDLKANDAPEWARAERLEFCDNSAAGSQGTGLMKSLRNIFGRFFR